jgi:hypothetical protein
MRTFATCEAREASELILQLSEFTFEFVEEFEEEDCSDEVGGDVS